MKSIKEEINTYLNSFTRPEEITPKDWIKFKRWAYCAHESYHKQLYWQFPVLITHKVQYEMLQYRGKPVIPAAYIRVELTPNVRKWQETNFRFITQFVMGGYFNEAQALWGECLMISRELTLAALPLIGRLMQPKAGLSAPATKQEIAVQSNTGHRAAAKLYRLRRNHRSAA